MMIIMPRRSRFVFQVKLNLSKRDHFYVFFIGKGEVYHSNEYRENALLALVSLNLPSNKSVIVLKSLVLVRIF